MGYTRLRHRILRRIEAVGRLREDMVPSICSVPFRDAIQRSLTMVLDVIKAA